MTEETKERLRTMQDKVDVLYKEHGLTDEVLDLQIEINTLRSELNIPDENDIIIGGFVQ